MAIVKVDVSNLESNPQCTHGPTLKFTRLVCDKRVTFYACSAYRDRKDCPFYLLEDEKFTETKTLRWEAAKNDMIEKYDRDFLFNNFNNILKVSPTDRFYCYDCNLLSFISFIDRHKNHHLFVGVIKNELLKFPTKILKPLEKNKKEAQYWFTDRSVHLIILYLKRLKIKNVLCLGTPSIHEKCRGTFFKSILLDIDPRYFNFYSKDEFFWFNMFNFHFMNDHADSLDKIKRFVGGAGTAVVVDPPFGARYEGLAYTLKKLSEYNDKLTYILILPFYMEPHVRDMGLDLEKLDYSVDYINHRFKNNKTPVRLFTNADQSAFPHGEASMKFCWECERAVPFDDIHCLKCDSCHNENYHRCDKCSRCLKKSYFHCADCNSCVNRNHVCPNKRCRVYIKTKNKKVKR